MTDAMGSGPALPDNIDHYPAGPALDAILAERVLGARVGRYREEWSGYENWVATTPGGAEFFIVVLAALRLWGRTPLEPLDQPRRRTDAGPTPVHARRLPAYDRRGCQGEGIFRDAAGAATR